MAYFLTSCGALAYQRVGSVYHIVLEVYTRMRSAAWRWSVNVAMQMQNEQSLACRLAHTMHSCSTGHRTVAAQSTAQ